MRPGGIYVACLGLWIMINSLLQKPLFPYFGGKRQVAQYVWQRLGNVQHYVEPFFGSGAVLWARPDIPRTETVNDAAGMLANCWRAIKWAPDEVAEHANWPVNENDLHARHAWLVGQKENLQRQLEGDPFFYDAHIAGWWLWGQSIWIGANFCETDGPWMQQDGALVHRNTLDSKTQKGIFRKRPHIANSGRGVHRTRPHISPISAYSERLAGVRVCCGDWQRVCRRSAWANFSSTGFFLDPPYGHGVGRNTHLYGAHDVDVTAAVREWCQTHGDNPRLRIILCGYKGEYDALGWETYQWKAHGGYSNRGSHGSKNRHRETLWISPYCEHAVGQMELL